MANEYNPINLKRLTETQREYLVNLFEQMKPLFDSMSEVCAEDTELRQQFKGDNIENLQTALDLARLNGQARIAREWTVELPNGGTYRGLPSYALV